MWILSHVCFLRMINYSNTDLKTYEYRFSFLSIFFLVTQQGRSNLIFHIMLTISATPILILFHVILLSMSYQKYALKPMMKSFRFQLENVWGCIQFFLIILGVHFSVPLFITTL